MAHDAVPSVVDDASFSTHAALDELGSHPWTVVDASPWLMLDVEGKTLPEQGWKLHVSAHLFSLAEVVACVLPILAANRVAAKIVTDDAQLELLNDGFYGLTQVGKAITVYPRDDEQAVVLARELDRATTTAALAGPKVPFDRRLHPRSLVHYRYGSFTARPVASVFGGADSMVTAPDGATYPDDRTRAAPSWAEDPFVASAVAAPDRPAPPLAGRYVTLRTLHRSARGVVAAGMDLDRVKPVVLKRAHAWGTIDRSGRDARDRARHEADILMHLAARGVPVPAVIDLVDDPINDDLVLVLLPGSPSTLASAVDRWLAQGATPPLAWVRTVGARLARVIQVAHDSGIVLVDLSPANVLIDDDDNPSLIDLEVAYRKDGSDPVFPRATTGYGAPHIVEGGSVPMPSDDVFSLGALLWLLLTGRPTALEPGLASLTRERLRVARPDVDESTADLVMACLARAANERPSDAEAVATKLDNARARSDHSSHFHAHPTADRDVIASAARRTADRLARDLERTVEGLTARRAGSIGDAGEDVVVSWADFDRGEGLAGLIAASVSVAASLDRPDLSNGAGEAVGAIPPVGEIDDVLVPGLFTGAAGVALAYTETKAGGVSDLELAVELARAAFAANAPSFDLINGSAGVIRSLLRIADAVEASNTTAAIELRQHAIRLAGAIRNHARTTEPWSRWPIPNGFGRDEGKPCLGYAHGAAGIGDVMIDVADATSDNGWLDLAVKILTPALPSSSLASGAPAVFEMVGGTPQPAVWCKGAAGLASVVRRLHGDDAARSLLDSIAATTWSGPSLCHGLAGQIDVLLDAGRVDDARVLATLLAPYVPGDGEPWLTSGLLTGNAGVAVALARCVAPDAPVPGILST